MYRIVEMPRHNVNIKEEVIYQNKLNRMPLTGLNDTELKLFLQYWQR